MEPCPPLEIPIRFKPSDITDVRQQVAPLGAAGKAAGDETAEGFRHAKQEMVGLTEAMAGLATGHAALSTLRQVGTALTGSMQDAADHVKRLADNFLATQKAMQGIAALTGKPNTDQFTTAQAQKAAAANLTPAEMTQFSDAFLSKASLYIGTGPSSKMSDAEADKYQASMAEFAKLHGVAPGEMADFAGGLLAQQKGPTTAADLTSRAGKVFGTLEASSAKVAHLLPAMTRVQAQNFTPEEAAPFLAAMPEVAPGEEGTYLLRLSAELRKLNLEGKAAPYGIKEGMSPAKQLETVITTLHAQSGGATDAKKLDSLIRGITHEDVAASALRGLVNQGPAGMKQWQGVLANTPADVVERDILKGRDTGAGRTMHAESQLALREIEHGEKFADARRMKMLAEADLTDKKVFDEPHTIEDAMRATISALSLKGTPVRQQRINERAVEMAFDTAGIPQRDRWALPVGAHQAVADEWIRRILEQGEKQTALLTEQNALMRAEKRVPLTPISPPGVARRE